MNRLTQTELNEIRQRAEKAAAGADAEFIAHAREDIPRLVAEIERLNAKLGECETLLSAAHVYDTELYEEITQYFYGGDDE